MFRSVCRLVSGTVDHGDTSTVNVADAGLSPKEGVVLHQTLSSTRTADIALFCAHYGMVQEA